MPRHESNFQKKEATFVVDINGRGDYADLQSAIDALPSGGGKIFVRAGTYTVGVAGIRITKSNVFVEGEGPATRFNFNTATLSTFLAMGDTSQRSNLRFESFRISQQGTAGTGVAIDASYFAQSLFKNITTDGTNGGLLMNVGGTLYNRAYNCTFNVSGAGSYGYKCGTTSNENTFYSCRTIGDTNTTGFIVAAHSVKLVDFIAEGILVGVDVQASGDDCTMIAPYLELNGTNLKVAANVESCTVVGGVIIDGTTYNIQNLGAKGLTFLNTRLQYEQFTYNESLNGFPKRRWVDTFFNNGAISATSQTATAGRVYLQEFEMKEGGFVDGISYVKAGTQAGNVRVGIYGPITTEETIDGVALLVESDSVAVSAGTNTEQNVALTKTRLNSGRYFVAIQFDDNTNTYMRNPNQTQVIGWAATYDRGGGYGAFTTPCPTTTLTGSAIPSVRIRLSGITTV